MSAARAFLAAALLLAGSAVAAGQPVPNASMAQLLERAEAGAPVRVLVGVRLSESYRPEGRTG